MLIPTAYIGILNWNPGHETTDSATDRAEPVVILGTDAHDVRRKISQLLLQIQPGDTLPDLMRRTGDDEGAAEFLFHNQPPDLDDADEVTFWLAEVSGWFDRLWIAVYGPPRPRLWLTDPELRAYTPATT
jgi:hypothetical protein